ISYLDRLPVWTEKGRTKVSLLTVDMPISKSSFLLHYPPQFRLSPVPGSFRTATYTPPLSSALLGTPAGPADRERQMGQMEAAAKDKGEGDDATRQAVLRLQQAGRASRPGRNLPIRVAFPHFGPSIFMVSELTSENQTPSVELDFQRDKKRGERCK